MKRRGELSRHSPTRHSHETILQWLAKCVEIAPWEFRQLVQEEHTPMRKRGFTRNSNAGPTAHKGSA
jgi:hypothetical protein